MSAEAFGDLPWDVRRGLLQRRDVDQSHAGRVQVPGQIDAFEDPIDLVGCNHDVHALLFHLHREPEDAEAFTHALAAGVENGGALGAGLLGRGHDSIRHAPLNDAGDQGDIGEDDDFIFIHTRSRVVCSPSRISTSVSWRFRIFHWTQSPVPRTERIGQMEAMARMPKPSSAPTAPPKPRPMVSTRGTVTGPVVTPALSQATSTYSSQETTG